MNTLTRHHDDYPEYAGYVNPKNILLSSGREVRHQRLMNGTWIACFPDGSPFTEAEWQEYIALLQDYHTGPISIKRAESLRSALLTAIGG